MTLTCTLLLAASVIAQPGDVPPFVVENVRTITFYYKSPDPELGPKLLKDLLRKENIGHAFFAKNDHVLNLIGSQFGDIVAGKPKLVREYEDAFADAPTLGRKVVVRALMNCGDKDTLKKVSGWLDDAKYADVKPELTALKKHLENPKRSRARDQAAGEPKDLDFLWGDFFTSGEYAPVSRILDVFDQADTAQNAVLKRVAKWSLGSNLQQHPKLAELVQQHKKDRPEGSRKVIGELIITPPKGEK